MFQKVFPVKNGRTQINNIRHTCSPEGHPARDSGRCRDDVAGGVNKKLLKIFALFAVFAVKLFWLARVGDIPAFHNCAYFSRPAIFVNRQMLAITSEPKLLYDRGS